MQAMALTQRLQMRFAVRRLSDRTIAVEKSVDKRRMNCAKPGFSSTEKFNTGRFYCSKNTDSLPVFPSARESTGDRKNFCEARLQA
jgi:hypothetical protein